MNETTNIPAILRGKPQGTKLHDLVRGIDVFLNNVVDGCDKVCCTFVKNGSQKLHYSSKGTLVGFEDGMVILVPSKSMHDWEKFAWKKGDVLCCIDGKCKVIFERFDDDTYTSFVGKYYIECYGKNDELQDYEEVHYGDTVNYTKESEKSAQAYIKAVEERCGGKLNKETLEVEKAQPEFKDGDIVTAVFTDGDEMICVFKEKIEQDYMGYCGFFSKGKHEANVYMDLGDDCICNDSPICKEIRLATEEEKQQLFEALAKEGKAWNAEKKQVVRLQVSDKLYYFEMENELAYIAKLKEAKGGKYTFESNVSWCPRNSTNGYDYEEGSFIVSDKDCYGFREANADECKIFEKFLIEHAMKSFKFKALDYVLAKNITCYESNAWNIFQYAYRNKDGVHIMVGGSAFLRCIPYVGNEDLLGTTKLYSTKK